MEESAPEQKTPFYPIKIDLNAFLPQKIHAKTFHFLQRLNLKGRESDDALVGVGRAEPQCGACFGAFQAFRPRNCLAPRFRKQQSSVDLGWDWTPWRGAEQPLFLRSEW